MTYHVRKAAVIGSGTMGGGIAALFAGLGIPTLLLDIRPAELTPQEESAGLSLEDREVRNRIVEAGWKAVEKSRPPAVLSERSKELITLGNLEDDFEQLAGVDLVVEAIVENLKIKQDLFKRIEQVRHESAIIASNTSGIPIRSLAEGRSDGFRGHFLGMHFFNPPRWLKLLEVIPHAGTLPEVLEFAVDFGTSVLGKGVVICKDTPNFIANRMFSIMSNYEFAYALENGYSIEEIDAIHGELIGRPKTAVFRLLDLVGNDIAAHVTRNLYDLIPEDESREILKRESTTALMQHMLEKNWLGNKSNVGFYKRVELEDGGKEFWVLNTQTLEHEPPSKPRFDFYKAGSKIDDLGERFRWIMSRIDDMEETEETRRLAEYIWETTAYSLGYASRRVPEIADRLIDIDLAMKWGFSLEIGPFEIWDSLGVEQTVEKLKEKGIAVADWVETMLDAGCPSFYKRENGQIAGYYDLPTRAYQPLEPDKRRFPIHTIKAGESAVLRQNTSATLMDMGDRIGLVEFHSKANALDQDIMEMLNHAMDLAEDDRFDAIVIGNEGKHFCAGANIFVMWMAATQQEYGQISEMLEGGQRTFMRMRYFPKPIVGAPHGMVLGGGAELTMACSRRVAAPETFIGLVETMSVGVIPAWTGTKEMLRRLVNPVMRIPDADPVSIMIKVFQQLGLAKVTTGAWEAFEMGFFQPGDRVIMNKDHLLFEAKQSALAMVLEGYAPPMQERIYAGGRDLLAALRAAVWDLKEAGWATEHDAVIVNKLAWVLCGGDLSEASWVPEEYILELERQGFHDLVREQKTLDRLQHMIEHNRPLRN
jgi:3-hydroxyacyl-CoA dehydrogenase